MVQEDFEHQLFNMLKARPDDLQDPYIKSAQATDPVQKRFIDLSYEDLNRILAAHAQWLETGGKAGHRANFSQVNLQGANLATANLSRANLAGADLRWVNSFGAELQGADLQGADLREAYLEEANLQEAIVKGANLGEAYLVGANLRGADLTQANLQQINLRMADLTEANLGRANLQNANLENAGLLKANLSFANLQNANLGAAEIAYANFENADLKGATGLSVSKLATVKNLSRAQLGTELKKQIHDHPPSAAEPKIQKPAATADATEINPLKNRQPNDRNSRKLPRKPFSKAVFLASKSQYCKGLIRNLNSGGAFVETKARFYRHEIIKIEIPSNKTDNGTVIIGEVVRSNLHGVGIKFKKLFQRGRFSHDMGGKRSGADRRKLLFSEYYPEKRSGADRRSGVDRRKLKYFKYYKYGLQLNRIVDNGGRRFTKDRRRRSFGLYWPESRKNKDRRSGKDRRTGFKTATEKPK